MMSQLWRTDKMAPAEELLRVQHLMPMSSDDRERLRQAIVDERRVKDALRGYFDKSGEFRFLTGMNRWQISLELIEEDPDSWGSLLSKLPIEVVEHRSESERESYAIRDNLDRRHLTTAQKREIVDYLLRQSPEASDRQIAKLSGATHVTVGTRRARLESRGEIARMQTTVGKDGKTYRKKPSEKNTARRRESSSQTTLRESVLQALNKAQIDMAIEAYVRRTGRRGISALRKTLDGIDPK
jgi:hypothetical protein